MVNQEIGAKTKYDEYRAAHGEESLSMHIIPTGSTSLSTPNLPGFSISEGFPVIVKRHNDKSYTLVNMTNGEQFEVDLEDYKKISNNYWMLDEAMMIYNPTQWKKELEFYRRGMVACGL